MNPIQLHALAAQICDQLEISPSKVNPMAEVLVKYLAPKPDPRFATMADVELVALRLMHALRAENPNNPEVKRAVEYLVRVGVMGESRGD